MHHDAMRKYMNNKRKLDELLDAVRRMRKQRQRAMSARRTVQRSAACLARSADTVKMELDAAQLAQLLDVSLRTAQRWAQRGALPKPYRQLYALLTTGELGQLFPGAKGFRVRPDCIVTDDGQVVRWAEMRALPFLVMALRESQRLVAQYRAAGAPRMLTDSQTLAAINGDAQQQPLLLVTGVGQT